MNIKSWFCKHKWTRLYRVPRPRTYYDIKDYFKYEFNEEHKEKEYYKFYRKCLKCGNKEYRWV